MQESSKMTFLIVKSQLSLFAIALLVAAAMMTNGCSKTSPEQPPVKTDETLRFVFLADSRGDSLKEPVNIPVLTAIRNQIYALSPKPSFIFFGGDMSYRGYIHPSYTFQAWKDILAPLGSGIPLYTAIGNHELYHEHASYGFLLVNQQEYQNVFSENPTNGPPGYEHLTYSFTSDGGNSFFAVLDPYYFTTDTVHMDLGGNIDATQMSWLKTQVAQTKATHKFLFIHTPYYYINEDTSEASAANKSYTALWSFLDSCNFDFYACGHSHLFSRKSVDSTVLPNPQTTPPTPSWQNKVVQLLNGTCGAIVSSGYVDPDFRTSWNVHNDPDTYYFSVVDITGNTVTVNSYSGNLGAYSVFDTFTITK